MRTISFAMCVSLVRQENGSIKNSIPNDTTSPIAMLTVCLCQIVAVLVVLTPIEVRQQQFTFFPFFFSFFLLLLLLLHWKCDYTRKDQHTKVNWLTSCHSWFPFEFILFNLLFIFFHVDMFLSKCICILFDFGGISVVVIAGSFHEPISSPTNQWSNRRKRAK